MEVANGKSFKQKLIQVIKNDQQIKETILLNILKMLYGRHIIEESRINYYYEFAKSKIDQNDETFFELDSVESEKLGSKTVHIKFIERKITTIRKVIDIETFMDKPDYKFVIVNNIAPKAVKQISEYKNTELFYDNELLINLIDHILIPKHIILTEEDRQKLLSAYIFEEKDVKNFKRMYVDDPVARYYNLKVDDIVRIERPSITSGISVDYRVVINGSIFK